MRKNDFDINKHTAAMPPYMLPNFFPPNCTGQAKLCFNSSCADYVEGRFVSFMAKYGNVYGNLISKKNAIVVNDT